MHGHAASVLKGRDRERARMHGARAAPRYLLLNARRHGALHAVYRAPHARRPAGLVELCVVPALFACAVGHRSALANILEMLLCAQGLSELNAV